MCRIRRQSCHMKIVLVTVLMFSILFLSACTRSAQNAGDLRRQDYSEEYQVKNYADGEVGAFGLNIATADDMGDWVVDWVSGVTDGKGFQYFIYSDPDSWDAYLYYPEGQAEMQMLTNADVAVEYVDGTLSVYVTARHKEGVLADGEGKWILHFMAPTFGAWPSEIKLYWNEREVSCNFSNIES